uniref:Taste receptor, type 1, member 1 n=1 Tax=Sparus aurata TaxID=8175 RepID=A0A671TNZ2_SPAAU
MLCELSMSSRCFLYLCGIQPLANGELDYISQGQGLQLQGDFVLAGLFPLHYDVESTSSLGKANQHGYHLMQAMRFAVEEINNSTGPQSLLPGVKLGYQIYDGCSKSAAVLAAVDLLEQWGPLTSGTQRDKDSNFTDNGQRGLALIGPDSSSKTLTPAVLLGSYLIPQISYESSNEKLSNKFVYPSFFRTIPSDKNQVAAIIQLLVHFNWTWVAVLSSDNDYGLDGMQSLTTQAPDSGICIAYQGIIPAYSDDNKQNMRIIVQNLLKTKVNTIVVFSSKEKFSNLVPFVIEEKMTDKVWIGSEDWSASSLISSIPGVQSIGTVLGVSIKYSNISGFQEFEAKVLEDAMDQDVSRANTNSGNYCLQSTDVYNLARMGFPLEKHDVTSSANVYKATYALAHALHQALGCDSGECQRRRVYPWELLSWLKQVQFTFQNTSVYFDANGDPPTGYDIVCWIWRGPNWSVREVGSFSPNPTSLTINADLIEWHNTGESSQVRPSESICSPPCPSGHRKLLTGQHTCCFDCLPCPAATFLNLSDPTTCQQCQSEEWAPPSSVQCLKRSVLLLTWDDPLAIALLFFLASCLLMTSSSAVILLLNLNTPVAKSAGGRTCLLMLAALTAAAMSSLCHFGQPSPLACILKQPLFMFSFTVCLACITVRSLQVVCIFKFASKLPPVYDKWAKKSGPEITIFLVSATLLVISVFRVALNPPKPSQDLNFYHDSIVLECSNTLSPGSAIELDLPANYNEAKSITFSLMVYMISWMSFFTLYLISRGPFTISLLAQIVVAEMVRNQDKKTHRRSETWIMLYNNNNNCIGR